MTEVYAMSPKCSRLAELQASMMELHRVAHVERFPDHECDGDRLPPASYFAVTNTIPRAVEAGIPVACVSSVNSV